MRTFRRAGTLLGLLLFWNVAVLAQSGVKVELDAVVDNPVTAGPWRGTLDFRVKLAGATADQATGARILVKEARDDRGATLIGDGKSRSTLDFMPRDYNSGMLSFSVSSPARTASSVKVKGTV